MQELFRGEKVGGQRFWAWKTCSLHPLRGSKGARLQPSHVDVILVFGALHLRGVVVKLSIVGGLHPLRENLRSTAPACQSPRTSLDSEREGQLTLSPTTRRSVSSLVSFRTAKAPPPSSSPPTGRLSAIPRPRERVQVGEPRTSVLFALNPTNDQIEFFCKSGRL